MSNDIRGVLLHALPACAETSWEFINFCSEAVRGRFFSFPTNLRYHLDYEEQEGSDDRRLLPIVEKNLIEGYLSFKRPRLAFGCIFKPEQMSPVTLLHVLSAIGSKDDEGGTNDGVLNDYDVERAVRYLEDSLNELTSSSDSDDKTAVRQLVNLEFGYIRIIDHLQRKTDRPLLIFRHLATDPEFYLEVHSHLWARNDDKEELPKLDNLSEEQREWLSSNAFDLLHHWTTPLPGQIDDRIDYQRLNDWVTAVRDGASEQKLTRATDSYIGQILAHSPIGTNGLIPDEPVCRLLNEVNSQSMLNGFNIGRYNARGVLTGFVDEFGRSTRNLSDLYLAASEQLRDRYPNLAKEFQKIAESYQDDADSERDWQDRTDLSDY